MLPEIHKDPFPLSGTTLKLKSGANFRVEDWADRVLGEPWLIAKNPASLNYSTRMIGKLPNDNNVLYGKTGHYGMLIHTSEIA